jgi:porin
VELFYNIAILPWCHLTGDFQVVHPSTQSLNTAIVAGLRLKLDF